MFVRSLVTALVAASPVFSLAIDQLPKVDGDLQVKLSSAGNTLVKASITSKADQTVSLLHLSTLFDASPVQKVDIHKDGNPLYSLSPKANPITSPFFLTPPPGKPIRFEGIFRYYQFENLPAEDFTPLKPGQTIETEFDIAETADLSGGGTYTISSHGAVPFTNGTSSKILGTLTYHSNELRVHIDGKKASSVTKRAKAFSKRTTLDDKTCTTEQKTKLDAALLLARDYAIAGTDAASNNNNNTKQFKEYFLADDAETRQDAAERLSGIAAESSSAPANANANASLTHFFCQDKWDWCTSNVVAYTLPSDNYIVACERFWEMPVETAECHAPDRGYVVLHEMAHAPAIKEPWCQDRAYGYDAVRRLTAKQAITNADTFSLFAAGVLDLVFCFGSGC